MVNLYKHQREFLSNAPRRHLLCWDCGAGKTLASILWAELMGQNALFVVPKSVKEKWEKEVKEYAETDSFKRNAHVVTKEEFRKLWDDLMPYDSIVVDEAHYFSGMRNAKNISAMAKSLFYFVRKHPNVNILLATATPYLSTPWNIYMLARILGHDWNYQRFKGEFFEEQYFGPRPVFKPRSGIEEEIADKVREIGSIIHINECADIPEQVFETEEFTINHKQKKAILDLDEMAPIVRFTKMHQIENGVLLGDGYTDDLVIPCAKTDRVLELCESNRKIAIVCRYNQQIEVYKGLITKKLKKKVYVINGKTKDKYGVSQDVERESDCVVLINAMASEAYELPSVPVCVFASLSYSYKDFRQMKGRFLRLNKLKKNVYINLITKDGVDEAVNNAINKKEDFSIAIYTKEMCNND